MSVKYLERLVTDKQGQGASFQNQGSSRPVRERLGRKSENGEGFGGRDVEDREEIGRERKRSRVRSSTCRGQFIGLGFDFFLAHLKNWKTNLKNWKMKWQI